MVESAMVTLLLGHIGMIDANGIDVAQPIWLKDFLT